MTFRLNDRSAALFAELDKDALGIEESPVTGGRLIDFGVKSRGGLAAGLLLADVCTAGLSRTTLVPGQLDDLGWPHVVVRTDHPVEACLACQYAGWQIKTDGFFGMGSGPMRAAAGVEELFDKIGGREKASQVVGVLESGQLPDADVFADLAEKCGVPTKRVTLCVARTASQAGNVQIVARSVETAMHKLFELGFDVTRIIAGFGVAPLPPVAPDDLTGIGRTNDAILYGGRVTLWATGDDESLAEVVKEVPSIASEAYGRPFLEICEAAGKDFYAIDPHLFSPAEVVLHNVETGRVHRRGYVNEDVLRRSFGL